MLPRIVKIRILGRIYSFEYSIGYRFKKKKKFPKIFEIFLALTNIFVFVRSRFLKILKYSNSFEYIFFKVEIFVFVRISMVIFASVREYDKYSKTFQTSIRSGKIYYIRSNSIRIVFDRIVSNSTRECLVHSNSIKQNLRRGVPAKQDTFRSCIWTCDVTQPSYSTRWIVYSEVYLYACLSLCVSK